MGRAILLDNHPVTVVGVLPASFDFGSVFSPGLKVDIYVPGVMDILRNEGNTLALVGRLKPGVTVAQAQAEVDVLMPQLRAAHKDWYDDYATAMTGLEGPRQRKLRRSLVVLWCAVGLILLIVCVNLSNLLLARAAARSKEFAMRSAWAPAAARIVRQLLTESLVLASAGAVLGLGIALAVTFYLARQGSDRASAAEQRAGRRRGAGLDAADRRRWPRRSVRPRAKLEDLGRQFAGCVEGCRPRNEHREEA